MRGVLDISRHAVRPTLARLRPCNDVRTPARRAASATRPRSGDAPPPAESARPPHGMTGAFRGEHALSDFAVPLVQRCALPERSAVGDLMRVLSDELSLRVGTALSNTVSEADWETYGELEDAGDGMPCTQWLDHPVPEHLRVVIEVRPALIDDAVASAGPGTSPRKDVAASPPERFVRHCRRAQAAGMRPRCRSCQPWPTRSATGCRFGPDLDSAAARALADRLPPSARGSARRDRQSGSSVPTPVGNAAASSPFVTW